MLALLVSGVTGSLIWTTPIGQRLETGLGLDWLFKLRGPRAAAAEALVVPINNRSSEVLRQPPIDRLDQWDRSLSARLIDRLAAEGAALIAFDVAFLKDGDDARIDEQLADAMRRAGNVILLEWVDQQRPEASAGSPVLLNLDRIFGPTAELAAAARAVAPWTLPKDVRIDRFPAYPTIAGSPRSTLPVTALHLFRGDRTDSLRRCVGEGAFGRKTVPLATVAEEILALRKALVGWSPSPQSTCGSEAIRSLAGLYRLDSDAFFNYYGEAGTLTGPPIHQWLTAEVGEPPMDVKGKAVFVGVAEYDAVQQIDSFYTVYRSGRGNTDISGVELAATAFANLLHQDYLKPPGMLEGVLILLAFGALIGLPAYRLPERAAIPTVLAVSVVYGLTVQALFSRYQLWPPLAIPLLIQLPLAIAVGWRLRFLHARRLKEAYRGAVEHYVPVHIAERIERVGHMGGAAEPLRGVVMHSDISGYTALAERLSADPLVLKELEEEYWKLIGAEIEREGGQMLEIAGDGMTCIWAAEIMDASLQSAACRAAVGVLRAADRFNARYPDTPFFTRIGMHEGKVALGNVGGGGHYTWAVGGDIANTAARLENDLNKLLGTRLAVSGQAIDALRDHGWENAGVRYLGSFLLRGKRTVIQVFEPMAGNENGELEEKELQDYHGGLKAFHIGDWREAENRFAGFLLSRPGDGPSAFYRRLSSQYRNGAMRPPRAEAPGLIDMNAAG